MNQIVKSERVDHEPFALPPTIIDLGEYTENITMLIYGDSGCGKTRLAGTLNEKALIIATENGTVSAARAGSKAKVMDCVHDFRKVMQAWEWLRDNVEDPRFPFKWLVIDSGTEMQNSILQHIVRERVEAGIAKSLNPNKVELQEYGEMHNMWRDYVRRFNDLPLNVLWTAHAMVAEDDEGTEFTLPSFQGKGYQIANWTAAQMHCYGHMKVSDRISKQSGKKISVREIQWKGTQQVRARDRFDVLPASTVNKTLPQIQKLIEADAAAA